MKRGYSYNLLLFSFAAAGIIDVGRRQRNVKVIMSQWCGTSEWIHSDLVDRRLTRVNRGWCVWGMLFNKGYFAIPTGTVAINTRQFLNPHELNKALMDVHLLIIDVLS